MDKDMTRWDFLQEEAEANRPMCDRCDHFRRPSEVHDYGFGWCVYLDDFTDSEDGEDCEGFWHV